MKTAKLFACLVIIALLLSLAVPVAAAPPADNPGNGPPEFAKVVFIHYREGAAPVKGSGSEADGYIYSGYHWFDRNIPVDYLVNLAGSGDDGTFLGGIQTAFQTWEDDPGSYMDFTYDGTTGRGISSLTDQMDGYNVVGWADISSQYGEEAIAVTIFWYQIGNLRLAEVDVAVNSDPSYAWWQNPPGEEWSAGGEVNSEGVPYTPDYPFDVDVQNIMTHEAGHWLVLDDLYEPYNSEKTMYGEAEELELKKRSLESSDQVGIRAIYPAKVPEEGPPPGDMHVDAIDMWYSTAGPNYFVNTKVTIVDADGAAVPEATVYLEMTLPDESTVSGSGATNSEGTVTFKLRSRQAGTYISTVTNVVKDDWTYDSEVNVETSDSLIVP